MIFLIEYDRLKGQLVRLERFDESERSKAQKSRLEVELDLYHRAIDHEVVLLEAVNEQAIRRTHQRYFEDIDEISKNIIASMR